MSFIISYNSIITQIHMKVSIVTGKDCELPGFKSRPSHLLAVPYFLICEMGVKSSHPQLVNET